MCAYDFIIQNLMSVMTFPYHTRRIMNQLLYLLVPDDVCITYITVEYTGAEVQYQYGFRVGPRASIQVQKWGDAFTGGLGSGSRTKKVPSLDPRT